jgi:hypothetical protein
VGCLVPEFAKSEIEPQANLGKERRLPWTTNEGKESYRKAARPAEEPDGKMRWAAPESIRHPALTPPALLRFVNKLLGGKGTVERRAMKITAHQH